MILFNAAAGCHHRRAGGRCALVSCSRRPRRPAASDTSNGTDSRFRAQAGAPLTAADLQSSLGGNDAGVLDNVTFGRLQDAPVRTCHERRSRRKARARRSRDKGGIELSLAAAGDAWQDRGLPQLFGAAASQLRVPSRRRAAGHSAAPTCRTNPVDTFVARLAWRAAGDGGATSRVTTGDDSARSRSPSARLRLPPRALGQARAGSGPEFAQEGRWHLRAWVDGVSPSNAPTSPSAPTRSAVSGVSADVFYGEDGSVMPAKPAKVSLSPFEVRWQ